MTVTTTAETHPLGPLKPPGYETGLLAVFKHRYLLKLMLKKELRLRYQGSIVGLGWAYIKPFVRFFMYFAVMGILLGLNRYEDFALHIFTGMTVLHLFTETFTQGTRAITRNKSLITKANLPRETFPVASLISAYYNMIPHSVVLVLMALTYGWHFDPVGALAGLLGLAVMSTFALASGLAFSAINVFYRDMQNLIDTLLIFITWSVPMIYPLDRLYNAQTRGIMPDWGIELYLLNPLANAVLLFERCWWTPAAEDPDAAARLTMPPYLFYRGFAALAFGVVLIYLAQWLFKRLEGQFAERL